MIYRGLHFQAMRGGIAMNLAAIGVPGLIIILVIILILFGPRKLPEIGSAVEALSELNLPKTLWMTMMMSLRK